MMQMHYRGGWVNTNAFEDFGELLLHVYRQSHELPLQDFQGASLEALRGVLPFDSSMWGSATQGPRGIEIHTLHLYRQPVEMLAGYEEIKHLDTAAAAVAGQRRATRGFDSAVEFAGQEKKAIRAYGAQFEQRHFFISSETNPANGLVQWVTLFRKHESAHCTEAESRLLAAIAPHLQQAMGYNRMRHFETQLAACTEAVAAQPERAQAVADLRGVVHHATPRFGELLKTEWHVVPQARLPEPLVECFRAGRARFVGHALVVRCHVEHGLLFVKARPCCAADRLSPCEWQVACLMSQGLSHKEVARRLERSPATVRNHIQAIYRRLGVGSVAELVSQLQLASD